MRRLSKHALEEAIRSTDGTLLEVSKYMGLGASLVHKNLQRFGLVKSNRREEPLNIEAVVASLQETDGSLVDSAALLGVKYNTLYVFIQRHNLCPEGGGFNEEVIALPNPLICTRREQAREQVASPLN